jgi:hypothetical protein
MPWVKSTVKSAKYVQEIARENGDNVAILTQANKIMITRLPPA